MKKAAEPKTELAKRLERARLAAGHETVAEAARYLRVNYATYAGHENGNSGFKHSTADLYARKFKVSLNWLLTGRGEMRGNSVIPAEVELAGLPVLGNIQAGAWLETSFIDSEGEPELIPAARDPRFPRARQYALRVVGDSMSEIYPDGSYVTCADFADSGLRIAPGQIVHVERHRSHGQMVEITLKEVGRRDGGGFMLIPRSSNPIHQPIVFSGREDDVIIKGVVTGGWTPRDIPT